MYLELVASMKISNSRQHSDQEGPVKEKSFPAIS